MNTGLCLALSSQKRKFEMPRSKDSNIHLMKLGKDEQIKLKQSRKSNDDKDRNEEIWK